MAWGSSFLLLAHALVIRRARRFLRSKALYKCTSNSGLITLVNFDSSLRLEEAGFRVRARHSHKWSAAALAGVALRLQRELSLSLSPRKLIARILVLSHRVLILTGTFCSLQESRSHADHARITDHDPISYMNPTM